MKKALVALGCIALGALGWLAWMLILADAQTRTFDGYLRLAALLVAPIASLVAAAASFWVAEKQGRTSKEIEQLKLDLGKDLESIKNRLSAERKAYDELYAAANVFYYTLSLLELGKSEPDRLKAADQGMVAATRYLIAIDEVDVEKWMKYWQECRAISEKTNPLTSNEQRNDLWEERAGKLGALANAFEEAARAKFSDPV